MPPAPPLVLLLTDPRMGAHAAPGHPERPERLPPVERGVAAGAAAAGAELRREAVAEASDEQLHAVHPPAWLGALEDAEAGGGGWVDPDTYLVRGSMRAARLAAGASARAALAAATGEAAVAFAVVRPPGHHAAPERAAGFCLLNNVAVAAAALRARGVAERMAILDWDVHHGDGTQAIFDADPDVVYASTHQSPLYPGSGHLEERGSGPGAGTMHNLPLPPGSGDDRFVEAWRAQLLPAVEAFRPEAVLVSAGYDAHAADPLANLEVSEAGYRAVATAVASMSARLGLRGVALTLEGGYDPAALEASAAATVQGLLRGGLGRG